MKNKTHPSSGLTEETVSLIRSKSAESEKLGELHPEILRLIYDKQWFNLFVPDEYGGLEMTLPEAVRLEESLAWADGSLGWTVTLCAGAAWFAGFLDKDLSRKIFSDKRACLAGSGAATGTAEVISGGYLVNGSWKYATGAPHATMITANCILTEKGEHRLNADGSPVVKAFIVDAGKVEILPEWDTIGLRATASQTFEINNLKVSAEHCFEIIPEKRTIDQPIFSYPFLQLAEVTLTANNSGMAIHFLDLAEMLFRERIHRKNLNAATVAILDSVMQNSKNSIHEIRNEFYTALDKSWETLSDGGNIPDEILTRVSKTSRQLAATARQCVDTLYPFCGLSAAEPQTDINRIWRDIHTASQHTLLTFP